MATTYTRPPEEILDVLHEAEAAGVDVPKIVDNWWKEETEILMAVQEAKKKA